MWIGSAVDGSLTEVDARTGRVVDTTMIDGLDSGGGIVLAGQNLWIANFDGELLHIDLDKHRVATRLRPFRGALGHVVSAGGWLWAVSFEEPTLLRMDPDTGEVTRLRRNCVARFRRATRRNAMAGLSRPNRATRPEDRGHTGLLCNPTQRQH
jgi:hypothetical protein